MNFYWGDEPMSWLRHMTLASYRYFHPDEPMTLWTSPVTMGKTWTSGEAYETYTGHDWRDKLDDLHVEVKQYVPPMDMPKQHVGDLCRYEVLADGGKYSDMDILYYGKLPELSGDAITCVDGILYIGITSGQKGGAFAYCLEESLRGYDRTRYQTFGVEGIYALAFGHRLANIGEARGSDTLKLVEEHTGYPVFNIPMSWVHPIPPQQMIGSGIPGGAETYGLHWFGGIPENVSLSCSMTPETWTHYEGGAISQALHRIVSAGYCICP